MIDWLTFTVPYEGPPLFKQVIIRTVDKGSGQDI